MYPQRRMRRLRGRLLQPLFEEHQIHKTDLIAPVFIDETAHSPVSISSMPGQFRYPPADASRVARELYDSGIRSILLFGIPKEKNSMATSAYSQDGVIQSAVRDIKSAVPGMVVITDVCACEYTDHGHCGIIGETCSGTDLLNDPSLEIMEKIAVSHASCGCDIVAPSCMLDGMVTSIRSALDEAGFEQVAIMSYSTKFSSALYGPFRDAADSGFAFGDRSTYQINPANGREAFLESFLDREEGADILMVKPGGFYLDLVARVATLGLPVAVYQVSGEYSMIKAAARNGWLNEKDVVMESMAGMKRAGADLIITYFARDLARWLDEEQ
ncbi:MAG TPA: porphobilinogen synthase [Methanoregulaceae archaeon]|nr:porphobilinogen synthase [Methanoregulaceae archaeon]